LKLLLDVTTSLIRPYCAFLDIYILKPFAKNV
jgi:hypothetical protein